MHIAFYAPMKPVDHPMPSGDRRMARAFLDLLRSLGHDARPVSSLRTLDREGNAARQQSIALAASLEVDRIAGEARQPGAWQPDLFFTYHNYHKAPDLLGPAISDRLGIPYIIAEASDAPKRRHGPWSDGYRKAAHAIGAADCVLAMTRRDLKGLEFAGTARRLVLFPPFLDTSPYRTTRRQRDALRERFARNHALDGSDVWLVCAAMMRNDIKLLSYRALAESLGRLPCSGWNLLVAGDGPARSEVEQAFRASGTASRVRMLGRLEDPALHALMAVGDIYVWPGLDEAYGMALLEAQASGLPALSFAEGGVADIVADGRTGLLVEDRSTDALAAALARLIGDERQRHAMGKAALQVTGEWHDIGVARRRLAHELDRLVPGDET